jgi:hypothetical protein
MEIWRRATEYAKVSGFHHMSLQNVKQRLQNISFFMYAPPPERDGLFYVLSRSSCDTLDIPHHGTMLDEWMISDYGERAMSRILIDLPETQATRLAERVEIEQRPREALVGATPENEA